MQVRLPMLENALPLYLQCNAIADDVSGAWCVTEIELYKDSSYSLAALVADDIPFANLPESSKDQLSAHIEAHWQAEHARRYFGHVHHLVMGSLMGAQS